MKRPDPILDGIAREHLLIPTLETQRADNLDFHNVAVWQVEVALKAAFDAGVRSRDTQVEPQIAQREEPVHDAVATPLLIPKGTPLFPDKMFLRLYHGRTDPGQELDEWGFVGPTFGPLSCYVHTYCCTFRIYGEFGSEVWLDKHDDMILWDDCFYGDMEVFIAGADDKA
jgi:hypothetical protein